MIKRLFFLYIGLFISALFDCRTYIKRRGTGEGFFIHEAKNDAEKPFRYEVGLFCS